MPDCQPRSVPRNWPVESPSLTCSSVNSPSFAPSRATWIIAMAGLLNAGSESQCRLIEPVLLHWLIERAPEIPRGDGPIRPPLVTDPRELFRLRQLSFAERFREAFQD